MVVICPECGKKTDLDNKTCSHCGCGFKQCPECGSVLKADAPQCDYCGVELPSAQEIERETLENERVKELHGKAERYFSVCAKIIKIFHLLKSAVYLGIMLFFAIAFFKVQNFGRTSSETLEEMANLLSSSATVKSQAKTFLVLSAIFFILIFFLSYYDFFIVRFILSAKIDAERFDYRAYCNYVSLPQERSEGNNDEKKRAIPSTPEASLFLLTCKEKIDPSAKIRDIIKNSILFIFMVVIVICLYVGCQANATARIHYVVLNGSASGFSYSFHTAFIVAIALFVLNIFVKIIINRIIPDENLDDWIKEYQSK